VTIDGQFVHTPIRFRKNAWFAVEGINAKSGKPMVVWLDGSDNNTFRRLVAWDATIDHNNAVIGVHRSSRGNLFEDVAAFGTARKVITNGYGGHDLTCRRCWFRWEGSIYGGSRTVSLAYNSTGGVFENVLATWSGESMPQTYQVVKSKIHMTDFEPFRPAGIVSVDRIDGVPPKHASVSLRGSIVYTKATDRIPTTAARGTAGGVFPRLTIFGLSSVNLQHVVSVMDPAHPRFNDLLGISLVRRPQNCTVKGAKCEDPVVNNTATNITSIRGSRTIGTHTGDAFGINGVAGKADETDWTVTKASVGTSRAAVQSPWVTTVPENGAAVCSRTVNGVITSTPLWPWPMNERIKAATATAGPYRGPCPTCEGGRATRTPTDVTADIEKLLGPIPASCKRS
jgi:hypothetical protein